MLTPGPDNRTCRITVEQAEADYFAGLAILIPDVASHSDQLKKPFGFCNDEWERLKGMIQPGDELWEVCTSQESWDKLMGWHSIELRRNDEVIAGVTIEVN